MKFWEFLERLWSFLVDGLQALALAIVFGGEFVPAGGGVRRA